MTASKQVDARPSLFEALGGEPALHRLVDRFYERARADQLLHDLFEKMPPEHVRRVALWLGEVLGGPAAYSKERGGHATVIRAHAGYAITEEQRRRWVELMRETVAETLPDDPALRDALAGYFEWGSRIAVVASQPGFVERTESDVPRWGWDGLEPAPTAQPPALRPR